MYKQINIPEQYWLKVENFDIYKFTDDDFRSLHTSPNILLNDFRRCYPNFDIIKNKAMRIKYKKIKRIDTPVIKKNNLPPINKKKSLKEIIDYSCPSIDILNKIIPKKYSKDKDINKANSCAKSAIWGICTGLVLGIISVIFVWGFVLSLI